MTLHAWSNNLLRFLLCFAEKRKANILDNLNNTNGTIIGVTCCIVLILLVVSVIVQIKQPRKKYILRREDFDPTMFQEVFQEPPHYELCTLRSAAATSADLAELAEDFESYHKLRRASSRCIHEHHCGSSQLSSNKGSRTNLSPREATAAILTDLPPQPMRPLPPQTNRRNILVMRHTYSQDAADACDLDDDLEEVPTTSHRLSRHEKAVQRSVSIDFFDEKNSLHILVRFTPTFSFLFLFSYFIQLLIDLFFFSCFSIFLVLFALIFSVLSLRQPSLSELSL